MLSASQSESSGLGPSRRLKRQDDDTTLDLGAALRILLKKLREDTLFAAVEDEDWAKLTTRMVADPVGAVMSRPFTEARPFYEDLFQPEVELIPCEVRSSKKKGPRPPSQEDRYDVAAAALRKNPLWKGVEEHVVMHGETSCRTAIDLIAITAVDLAQQEIANQDAVDQALCARHSLPERGEEEPGSWVVLYRDVDVDPQPLLPGLAMDGILDYLFVVVAEQRVHNASKSGRFLTQALLQDPPEGRQHIGKALALVSVAEAKTMHTNKAWAQATAQGAALCVSTTRSSVVNTLTDGTEWKFICVSKTPDQPVTSNPNQRRRSSTRVAATASKMAPIPEIQPFTAESTRWLNIFQG
ncbi:hypothetical protein B0H16DRAFT_1572994 [Mycena metata]|uniref:Uncharacterized protein n=1 Tax=Mycena metata TaxID=1033252 RepID=A0AAD7I7L4_9AGAR|nr:hypothetical protein B0H16DRAFT_1572994 [Mycena metata]